MPILDSSTPYLPTPHWYSEKIYGPILWLCLTLLVGCKEEGRPEQTKKPNIVFILADDLGIHDLSITGSDYYETPNIGEPSSIVREDQWKLIHYYEDGRQELYDLKADPTEQNDVFSENPEVAERLGDLLQAFLEKTGANRPTEDTAFDPALAKKQHQDRVEVLMPKLEAQRMEFLSEDFEPNKTWWNSQSIEN